MNQFDIGVIEVLKVCLFLAIFWIVNEIRKQKFKL